MGMMVEMISNLFGPGDIAARIFSREASQRSRMVSIMTCLRCEEESQKATGEGFKQT